jgi:8-oxo-dGTP diphosphatase
MPILTAGILLFRKDGRVLLQHRDEGIVSFPGMWGFFGGHIEDGETPEQAMLREAREELGIDVRDYWLSVERKFINVHGKEQHTFLFVAPAEVQGPLVLGEGQAMGWFLQNELDATPIVPHCLETLQMIFAKEWR